MKAHKNARTTPFGRAVMLRRVLEEGWSVAAAADATDGSISAIGSSNDTLVVADGAARISYHRGKLGFVYARLEALSPQWIAAEYANLSDPDTFYSITP